MLCTYYVRTGRGFGGVKTPPPPEISETVKNWKKMCREKT